jgi:hypothetical protein
LNAQTKCHFRDLDENQPHHATTWKYSHTILGNQNPCIIGTERKNGQNHLRGQSWKVQKLDSGDSDSPSLLSDR